MSETPAERVHRLIDTRGYAWSWEQIERQFLAILADAVKAERQACLEIVTNVQPGDGSAMRQTIYDQISARTTE
jgi:hypothetical protein